MRRRPLLRAAAVAGGAYMAGKKTAGRQAAEEQAYPEQDTRTSQPARPAAGSASGPASVSDQLSQLKSLHDQGMLTDEEFSAAKAKVLGI